MQCSGRASGWEMPVKLIPMKILNLWNGRPMLVGKQQSGYGLSPKSLQKPTVLFMCSGALKELLQ
jgi:hypothetical protein